MMGLNSLKLEGKSRMSLIVPKRGISDWSDCQISSQDVAIRSASSAGWKENTRVLTLLLAAPDKKTVGVPPQTPAWYVPSQDLPGSAHSRPTTLVKSVLSTGKAGTDEQHTYLPPMHA